MITCSYPRDHVYAGETAVCLLKGSQITESYDKAIIFAQVHGHISVDFRWLKVTHRIQDVFVDEDVQTVDKTKLSVKDPHPVAQHHTPCCIFTTSRVAVSPTHVFEGGTFLEFEMPAGSLPTYRGLCATVYYFVSLTVQFQSGVTTLHFPMPVQGSGTTEEPFLVRHTSLVAYPAATLPEEVLMSAPAPGSRAMRSTDGDNEAREVPNVYMIRDRDHICDLHLPSKVAVVGRELLISLDFSQCVQACTTVSATLVMAEMRPDATRVQEKAVCKATRVATDAEWLDLSLYVPDEAYCSFSTPLFMVAYRLNVEFTLERRRAPYSASASGKGSTNTGSNPGSNTGSMKLETEVDEPFSFSIPILVYQEYQPRAPPLVITPGMPRPSLIAPWSAQFVQQQALLCLESKDIVRPV